MPNVREYVALMNKATFRRHWEDELYVRAPLRCELDRESAADIERELSVRAM